MEFLLLLAAAMIGGGGVLALRLHAQTRAKRRLRSALTARFGLEPTDQGDTLQGVFQRRRVEVEQRVGPSRFVGRTQISVQPSDDDATAPIRLMVTTARGKQRTGHVATGDPAFDDRYLVLHGDEAAALALLNASVRERLDALCADAIDPTIVFEPSRVAWEDDQLVDDAHATRVIEQLTALVAALDDAPMVACLAHAVRSEWLLGVRLRYLEVLRAEAPDDPVAEETARWLLDRGAEAPELRLQAAVHLADEAALIELIGPRGQSVRDAAADALGRLGGEAALEALRAVGIYRDAEQQILDRLGRDAGRLSLAPTTAAGDLTLADDAGGLSTPETPADGE